MQAQNDSRRMQFVRDCVRNILLH